MSRFYVGGLEQDAFEVLRLVRSLKNRLTPIHRIPPELFDLILDFVDVDGKDTDLWREISVSRPSFWTTFDRTNADQTRTYLERRKASPVDMYLTCTPRIERTEVVSDDHPFVHPSY